MRSRKCVVPVLLLALGCQTTPSQPPAPGAAAGASSAATAGQPTAPESPRPVPAQLPDIVARVNGRPIERAEFELAVKNVEARAGQPVPPEQRDQIYRGVLNQIVTFHLLDQETTARKLTVSDAELDARLAQIRQQFPTEEQFKAALAARSVNPEKLKQNVRSDLLVNKMLAAEVGDGAPVQDQDVAEFYAKNPDRFHEPEAVRASHILLRLDEKADAAARKALHAKAMALLQQVRRGKDFAALAREHSQDGSAANGGDLNFFNKGQMVPAFEAAAFALKPGAVSTVVETPFGYHLIKVTDRRAERTVPLTEARAQLTEFLTKQAREARTEAFIAQLRTKSRIEILM